jgi:hypothetical protein
MTRISSILATSALALALTAAAASAATLSVSATANGMFGNLVTGTNTFVAGPSLAAGETVQITATGTITLGENLTTDANGVDVDSSSGKVFSFEFTPLEEAALDAGGSDDTLMENLGALIGAFVPTAEVTASDFRASDEDISYGRLSSSALFFVGTSLTYTAAEAGTLFFGINEGYVLNNSGAFSVTVEPSNVSTVPLPAGLPLLAGALALGAGVSRRRRG